MRARGRAAADGPGTPRLRPGRSDSLRVALTLIAAFALTLAIVQLGVGAGSPTPFWIPVAFTLVFAVWTTAGVIAWWRRPGSFTGALLLVGALAVFIGGVGNLGPPALLVLSAGFGTVSLAVTVHLLHAFPTGRLRGRLSVVTVAAGYGVALLLQAPLYLIPAGEPALAVAEVLQRAVGVTVMVVTAVILVGRLRATDPQNRPVLLPLYLYGTLTVLLIPVSANLIPLLGGDYVVVGAVQLALLAGIPVAFLLGVLFGGFARTADADVLSTWLGVARVSRTAVAEALARSLGDDSLRVAYWSSERGTFIDEQRAEVKPPPPGLGDRDWQEVHVEGRLVGAISFDRGMISDPEAVRRAGRVLAIALDRERLLEALVDSNEALGRSRIRLVETADRERTRIARDLHDGLQVQLVLLALEAQQIANVEGVRAETSVAVTELRRRIDAAAADLRRLVHDVLPSALVERGLTAAAEDLVDRVEIPTTLQSDVDDRVLDPAVARTAYMIVAEALTNATKHSGASAVGVTLSQHDDRLHVLVVDDGNGGARLDGGTGLKGLVDRVDALGGSFELISGPGAGTELRVELPCGS